MLRRGPFHLTQRQQLLIILVVSAPSRLSVSHSKSESRLLSDSASNIASSSSRRPTHHRDTSASCSTLPRLGGRRNSARSLPASTAVTPVGSLDGLEQGIITNDADGWYCYWIRPKVQFLIKAQPQQIWGPLPGDLQISDSGDVTNQNNVVHSTIIATYPLDAIHVVVNLLSEISKFVMGRMRQGRLTLPCLTHSL